MLDRNDNLEVAADAPSIAAAVPLLMKEIYFPTQIYYCDLQEGPRLNALLKSNIYSCRDHDPNGIVRSNARTSGSWHSTIDLHERPEFGELITIIRAMCDRIFTDLGYDPLQESQIVNLWANVNPRYGYNRSHVHPNSLWSGVYYVQAPSGCGRLFFRDPRPQAQVMLPAMADGTWPKELWSEVFFEPVEGRVIVFPAWLQHEVEANLSTAESPEGDRISLSFNIRQGPAR